MLRLDGADAWSIGRWGRVVGDEAAVLEEVIRRIQVLASQTTFTEVVPFSEVIRPALFESPDIFLRAYERARKVYEVVQEEGNEVVYEVVHEEKNVRERRKEKRKIEKGKEREKGKRRNDSDNFCNETVRNVSEADDISHPTDQCRPCDISSAEVRYMEVRAQLQKRLAGFVIREVQTAHSFIESFCGQDGHGKLWRKRWALRINNALIPLIRMVGLITTHKRLNQLSKTITDTPLEKGKFFVYARVNLRTNDLYIGETGNWTERFKQHFTAMHKHSQGAINGCKRCREHGKYKKHVRYVAPHEWMMIPIAHVGEKWLAKRTERTLIRKLNPSLNKSDKPFWLLKDTYANLYKGKRGAKRTNKPPWRTHSNTWIRTGDERPMFTTYEHEGRVVYDISKIFDPIDDTTRALWVKVTKGDFDLTKWKQVKRMYGESRIVYPSDTENTGLNSSSLPFL